MTTTTSLTEVSPQTTLSGHPSCLHDPNFHLFTQDDGFFAFCGLCRLIELWEDEVPRKVHAYKVLAENGKPEVAPAFFAHLQASVGLIPPKPGESLKQFSLARSHLYRAPSKNQYPLLRSLWDMMGFQPKLAQALIYSLQGVDPLVAAHKLQMTSYGVNLATAKGIRLALRNIRSYNGR